MAQSKKTEQEFEERNKR